MLHIIFGNSLGLDLVSVYDEQNLLRLYASVLSYGYLGDVAYHSDQYRWMGPRRYDFSGELIFNFDSSLKDDSTLICFTTIKTRHRNI